MSDAPPSHPQPFTDMTTPQRIANPSDLTRPVAGGESHLLYQVDETWLQGRSVFGGMQMAIAFQSARRLLSLDCPLRSLHATFLAPIAHDMPIAASAKLLRAGRSVTQLQAQLQQGGLTCFECTAIVGADRATETLFDGATDTGVAPEKAFKLNFTPGLTPNFIQHYDLRWAKGRPPFSAAADPSATIFVRPSSDDLRYNEAEVLALADVIPPPAISLMRKPAPASTMNCALELIQPQAIFGTRQWIRFEVVLHSAHSGYAWQTAHVYSEAGQLIAIAHQSVAIFG